MTRPDPWRANPCADGDLWRMRRAPVAKGSALDRLMVDAGDAAWLAVEGAKE